MSSRLFRLMNAPDEPDLFRMEEDGVSEREQNRVIQQYLDFNNNFEKALDKFKQTKLMKIINMEYMLGKLGTQMEQMKEYEKELGVESKEETAKENHNSHVWITVSPKPTVSFKDFRKVVEKLTARKLFSKYCYTYEQRGMTLTDCGAGFHVHILAVRNLNYKPNKVITHIKNTVKNICDVERCCRIQIIGEDFAKDKMEYMLGEKTGGEDCSEENKKLKQKMDKVFRDQEKLQKYFGEKII